MLPTIEKSERFKREYTRFKDQIENINAPQLKQDLLGLLEDLFAEVRKVDNAASSSNVRFALTNNIPDSKNRIAEIRKRLTKKLGDYRKASV